jgi:hypothetical protein
MPGLPRSGILVLGLLCSAAALGCSPGAPALRTCSTEAECPPAARCRSGACVANAPPVPSIALPTVALQANALLSFDGSASSDPDAGDSVVSHAWTFRALAAACAPPVVAGAGPLARVRFGCAGRYAVDLTTTDEMAAAATATAEIDVASYSGPALVVVSGDVVLDHACTSPPVRCAPTGDVVLSAAAPALAPGEASFSWTVEPPPDRPIGPGRRVVLAPDSLVASPTVSIETDGEAISGDWIFTVEARDAAGVVGTATTRVSVANRPPVVVETIPVPDHAFDGSQLTASGEVTFSASDPDGDPLVDRSVRWHHSGDGASTFAGVLLEAPSRATFSIAVPYVVPGDALHLIGGSGLERTIVFAVGDVNGGVTVEGWPIRVGNRPPVLVSAPASFAVEHAYDPAAAAYSAVVPLSTWSDPDGDPLARVVGASTTDPVCPSFDVPPSGVAIARCSLPFAGAPAVSNFAGTHAVVQRVQDPWEEAAQSSTVHFTIGNRPPVITSTDPHVSSSACTVTGCCHSVPGEGCLLERGTAPAASTSVPSRWSDPDGDPLEVEVGASATIQQARPLVCASDPCPLELDLAEQGGICGDTTETLSIAVTDGAASASDLLPVRRECG